MTSFDVTSHPSLPNSRDPVSTDASLLCAPTNGTVRELRDLRPILAFLRHEIRRSGGMLHDLAESLSEELSSVGAACGAQSALSAAVVALQNEDRIQQRLGDSEAVLLLLEQTVATGVPAVGADLDQAIIDCLKLEESRGAYAADRGLSHADTMSPNGVKHPSLGDIDLF